MLKIVRIVLLAAATFLFVGCSDSPPPDGAWKIISGPYFDAALSVTDGRFEISFTAEVVQAFPVAGAFGTGFQLVGWDEKRQKELERRLKGGAKEGEMDTSPMFRIKTMDPNQRFRLALRGNRTERAILLRDTSPQVLLGLLSHPQLETKEVVEIVNSNFASSAIMERVAKNRQWLLHPDIPATIVKSPKTPAPVALKLLEILRKSDLQKLAKGAPRENIRKAALKLYEKRNRGR